MSRACDPEIAFELIANTPLARDLVHIIATYTSDAWPDDIYAAMGTFNRIREYCSTLIEFTLVARSNRCSRIDAWLLYEAERILALIKSNPTRTTTLVKKTTDPEYLPQNCPVYLRITRRLFELEEDSTHGHCMMHMLEPDAGPAEFTPF